MISAITALLFSDLPFHKESEEWLQQVYMQYVEGKVYHCPVLPERLALAFSVANSTRHPEGNKTVARAFNKGLQVDIDFWNSVKDASHYLGIQMPAASPFVRAWLRVNGYNVIRGPPLPPVALKKEITRLMKIVARPTIVYELTIMQNGFQMFNIRRYLSEQNMKHIRFGMLRVQDLSSKTAHSLAITKCNNTFYVCNSHGKGGGCYELRKFYDRKTNKRWTRGYFTLFLCAATVVERGFVPRKITRGKGGAVENYFM